MVPVEAAQRDREIVDDVVRNTPRPDGVGVPLIDFSEDHSGDDSVYITYPASRKIVLTSARLKQLTKLADEVRDKLFERGLVRNPYIRFSESR